MARASLVRAILAFHASVLMVERGFQKGCSNFPVTGGRQIYGTCFNSIKFRWHTPIENAYDLR